MGSYSRGLWHTCAKYDRDDFEVFVRSDHNTVNFDQSFDLSNLGACCKHENFTSTLYTVQIFTTLTWIFGILLIFCTAVAIISPTSFSSYFQMTVSFLSLFIICGLITCIMFAANLSNIYSDTPRNILYFVDNDATTNWSFVLFMCAWIIPVMLFPFLYKAWHSMNS